ncbi:hypothetical protein ANANG_G00022570 [Anguilla anguilla]|uniref:SH3 domain-containing protein n=1 Tax=Anguilla anguilla TaxID=7936 RepID=A0A9D3MZH9_ANGAN|nr:hypothetical protein ANANG_G00022570 [Anguilla anguilla]
MGGVLADLDNANVANGNPPEAPPTPRPGRAPETNPCPSPPPPPTPTTTSCPPPTEELTPGQLVPAPDATEDANNNNPPAGPTDTMPSPIPEASHPEEEGTTPATPISQPTVKRTNLKKPDSERTGHGLRVKFNPLALLLDASLEGEFDLVQRIIYEVENPSKPNDEGITPLHNAVCAGPPPHRQVPTGLRGQRQRRGQRRLVRLSRARFRTAAASRELSLSHRLVAPADCADCVVPRTPLHCAASCNSVHLCKMLVESGAAIFATTISDVETAADKCEEMEEGYIQCSQFLYGVQEKLGVMNKGTVYGLWDYEAQSPDELSFREGDAVTVLRRKDDSETEWWWARLNDKEGYIPRNLLGLYPRIKPRQRSLA